jgi:oligopeptide transport system permease protein
MTMTNTLAADAAPEVKGRSLWANARHRFLRNRAAATSAVIFCLIAIVCFVAPHLGMRTQESINYEFGLNASPDLSQGYVFGTDGNGRDLFVRSLYGGQVSLMVGFTATMVSLVIGVIWGATAGFIGGRVDGAMMRLVDILYSLPFIFFVIMLVVFFGRNFVLMFLAVGAVLWLDMARIVRGQALSIRRQEYVQAAEALGVGTGGILRRHIVPNLLGPVVIYMTLLVPQVIILESFLSFLGLGVQEPMTSWGVLISQGAKNIGSANWLLLFPAFFLVSTLFALNFIGDGLRDALDPKDR